MKKTIFVLFFLLLFIFLFFVFWSNEVKANVEDSLRFQQEMVNSKDMEGYMSTIFRDNLEYYAEKESWFRDLVYNEIEDYRLEVIDVDFISFNKVKVTVDQSYTYNDQIKKVIVPLVLQKVNNSWKDNDLDFKSISTENFVIKYFKSSKKQGEMIKLICEEAKFNVENRYGSKINEKTTIKVYENLEMLRQSVKLSFPWQFAGWYEYPESIKTSEFDNKESYKKIIEHELVHKISLKESNNNIPYWLTEGLAVYLSNYYNEASQIKTKEQYIELYGKRPMNILELEAVNLERLTDNSDISQYYDSTGLIVKYLADKYGVEKLRELIRSLGRFPYLKGTGSETDRVAQERLRSTIQECLGINIDQLNYNWDQYINNK